jgi:hypothetical protein
MPLERKDVQSAVEAHRELGPAYEDEIVDSLLAKIDQRLEEQRPPAAPARHGPPMALLSLVFGIPITAIAGGLAGLAGIIVVWIGIVLVNVASRTHR